MSHVIAPRDIYEPRDGVMVMVYRKGDRLTVDEAKRHKLLPIMVSDAFRIETK
jgi:hypothetical protein